MSDKAGPQGNRPSSGQADAMASRTARLQTLERLLVNISQHLRASGGRHGDVLAQLHDRLGYLRQNAVTEPASHDADRHLALFEAQLTSLAIRTGVPTRPQHPGNKTPQPQASNARPRSKNSSHQPAPQVPKPGHPARSLMQQRPTTSPAAPEQPSATGVIAAATVAPPVADSPLSPPPQSRKPIGAPPPDAPPVRNPGTDALSRQSAQTFEEALAADRDAKARVTEQSQGAPIGNDAIFAYHPPIEPPTTGASSAVGAVTAPQEKSAPRIPADSAQPDVEPKIPPAAAPASVVSAQAAPDAAPPENENRIESLRADLESVLATDPKRKTTGASDLVARRAEAGSPSRKSPAPSHEPTRKLENRAPDTNVVEQIARLGERVDSLSTSVERIEASLKQTRTEIPGLIDKAADTAAARTAKGANSADAGMNRRIDELRALVEDNLTVGQEGERAPRSSPGSRYFEQNPTTEGRLEQAKRSMMQRLAPVGEAISRRVTRGNSTPSAQVPAGHAPLLAPRQDLDHGPTDEHTLSAPSHYAKELSPEPVETSIDVTGEVLAAHPDDDLTKQSISGLRKSLFQSMKHGAPPAIVLVVAVLGIISATLLWNRLSGSPDQIALKTTSSGTSITAGNVPQPALATAPKQITTTALTFDPAANMSPESRRNLATRLNTTAAQSIANAETGMDEQIRSTGLLKPSSSIPHGAVDSASPMEPAALKPGNELLSRQPSAPGGSKLALPPLATGPLSLRLAAASGDPAAQFDVASRLAQGNGVKRDPVAAVKWYTRAASSGHARAQYRLAALYERGTGVATDTGRAKVWYTRAAQQGNVKAMHNLAVLYAGQSGGSPNYVNAVQWFERAAEYNLADSQFNVAILYLNGLGVTKNRKTAYKWFALAARQGDQEATRRLKGITGTLSATEQAAAKQVVNAWRAKPVSDKTNSAATWRPSATSLVKPQVPALAAPSQASLAAAVSKATLGPIGKSDILKVQRLLNGLGFNTGSPDGKIGSRTRSAIKSFQSQNGMIPTGIVDHALVGRIEQMTREKAVKLGNL